jgi:hypothetical protein
VNREHVETMGLDVVQGLRFAGIAAVFALIDLHLEILLVVDIAAGGFPGSTDVDAEMIVVWRYFPLD